MFLFNGEALAWKCTKKSVKVNITTKFEYIAAKEFVKEPFWMKKFIRYIGLFPI